MTDREKLLKLLSENENVHSFEECIDYYICIYYHQISAMQLTKAMSHINSALAEKTKGLTDMKFVAKERATYLEAYLSGKLWATEEAAKQNLQPQIENARAIINACEEATS